MKGALRKHHEKALGLGVCCWLWIQSAMLATSTVSEASTVTLPSIPSSPRSVQAEARVWPALQTRLRELGAASPLRVYLRVFKEESSLELWVASGREVATHATAAAKPYMLFRSYPICAWSGQLGGKKAEGDMQAPEGAYEIRPGQLNPNSQFHLSFNLGYPNRYERAQGFTGSALMVHGNCVSIGCYAMTDPGIEEIYTLVAKALSDGQDHIPVHAFPFRMEADALVRHTPARESDRPLWQQLRLIYERFERDRIVPNVAITTRGYQLAR